MAEVESVEIGPETPPCPNKRVIWIAVCLTCHTSFSLTPSLVLRKNQNIKPQKLEEMSLACFDYIHVNSHLQRPYDDHNLTADL